MKKIVAAIALVALAAVAYAQIANVSSDWSSGNLRFKDASGNVIVTFDGTNRKLSFPSGSTLELASGAVVSRAEQALYIVGAKAGATAGWTVAAAANRGGVQLPASQTNATLVIPITGLKVGDQITGFSLVGQVESAGNTATITADLRKLTAAAADLSDASVGAMAAPASLTADAILSSSNASKTGLSETVGADESFYVLVTGTTAASTDVDLQGVLVSITRQ